MKTQNKVHSTDHTRENLKQFNNKPVMVINMDKSDREIWNSFRKGDEEAFNYIYRKNVSNLYNYGYQICKDKDLVKDCIQSIFVDLRKKAEKLGEVSKISGYLFTVFHREIFRVLKAKNKIQFESIDDSPDHFLIEVSHETKLITQEFNEGLRMQLDKAVNQLPAKQRQALLLLYQEELSYKEIAQIMDFGDVKTARTLVYKAISNVKSKLGLE